LISRAVLEEVKNNDRAAAELLLEADAV